jgi:plastocyanin
MTFGGAHHRRQSATTSVSILVAAMLVVGCIGGLPSSSQNGRVQDIVIGYTVTPSEITLAPGDEVRWTNRQGAPVDIVFLNSVQEQTTCGRGFGLGGVANGVRLAPNRAISLCFATPGHVRYTVHLDTPTPTGQFNVQGVVHIEQGG